MALTDNLLAWWSCNESSNATVYDAHTTNVDSTAQSFTGGNSGVIGNCLTFNGSSNYVSFDNACRPTSAISVSFWMRASTQSSARFILCNTAWSTNWYGWRVELTTGGAINFMMFDGAGNEYDGTYGDVDDDTWRHVVITFNGTTVYYYVNNSKSSGDTGYSGHSLGYHTNCDLHFGSNEEETESWYNGRIDLVGVWSRALTDSEVAELYASGSGLDYPFTTATTLVGNTHGVALLSGYMGGEEAEDAYYVKNGGNDSADGRSDANAWATISKVNGSSFSPGAVIYFRRGDTWQEEISLNPPSSGSSSGHITFSAYGSGAKPLLLGSCKENSTGDWTVYSGNIWQNSDSSFSVNVGNLIFNNEASWGNYKTSLGGVTGQGDFFFNVSTNVLYLYSSSNPATYYSNIECALDRPVIFLNGGEDYLIFENLDVRYSGGHGLSAYSGCDNIIVRDCNFQFIGGGEFEDGACRYGNAIQFWQSSSNITIERNTFDHIYDAAITPQYSGTGSAYISNWHIRSNLINRSEYSFEFFVNAAGGSVSGIYFQNNTCCNAGLGFGDNQRPDSENGYHIRFGLMSEGATNFYIRNNIYNTADQGAIHITTEAEPYVTFDYNCYNVSTVAYDGDTYTTLASWQAFRSDENNSISDNPDFVSSTDWHLLAISPCIGEGLDVGYDTDFDEVAWDTPPSMGAYEYSSGGSNELRGVVQGVARVTAGLNNPGNSLLTDIKAYWAFDEASGTLYDSTDNNYDLSTMNSPTYQATGLIGGGYAIQFNGVDEYAYRTSEDLGNFGTSDFTVSGWLYLVSSSTYDGVLGWWGDEPYFYINFDSSDHLRVRIGMTVSYTYVIISNNTLSTGTWYHFAVMVDRDGNLYMYINGVLQNDTADISSWASTNFTNPNEFNLGQIGNHLTGYYGNVRLDGLGIWERLLTTNEVESLYNGGSGLGYPFGDFQYSLIGNTHGTANLIASFTALGGDHYYVSTSGADEAGRDGSYTEPWASLSYAAGRVSTANSIIHVLAGNYTDNNRVNLSVGVSVEGSGTGTSAITTSYTATGDDGYIRMYSSSNTDGNNTISYLTLNGNSLTSRRAIYAENRNSTVVHHCTIYNFLVGGIYFESEGVWDEEPSSYMTNCSIYNCSISNCSDRYYDHEGCVRATACHNLTIYNCDFTNNSRTTSQNGNIFTMTFQRGSKFYNNTFTKGDHDANGTCPRCWNFFVELFHPRGGVEFYDNTFVGAATLDLGGAPGQGAFIESGYGYTYSLSIHDNTFNTSTNAQLSTQDGGKNHIAIDLETNLEYIYVYNNHIKNYPTGIGMVTSTLSQTYDQNHVYIYNNLIENVGYTSYSYTYGIYVNNEGNPPAYSGSTDNLHIWNNTIEGGAGNNYYGIICHLRGTFTNSSMKNNIIYDFDSSAVYISRQTDAGDTLYLTDVDVTYNDFYSNGTDGVTRYQVTGETSCDFSTGNITTIPGLDSDWHITSESSNVYQAGTNVGLSTDYDGHSYLSPPSMGCFEYGTGTNMVPDTYDFCLSAVVLVVQPTTEDLEDCFADSIDAYFDPIYKGNKDRLYNFRNYGGAGVDAALQGNTHGNATVGATFTGGSALIGNTHGVAVVGASLSSTGGTYCDWYLPSLSALVSMDTALQNYGVGNFVSTSGYYYWTSSEISTTNAYSFSFNTGSFASLAKGTTTNMLIRPYRSFTSASGSLYALRDTGPAGGLIFAITGPVSGLYTYYEAGITDIYANHAWSNITNALAGATPTGLYDGIANSNAIVAQAGHTDSAAAHCLAYCAGTGDYTGELKTTTNGVALVSGTGHTTGSKSYVSGNSHGAGYTPSAGLWKIRYVTPNWNASGELLTQNKSTWDDAHDATSADNGTYYHWEDGVYVMAIRGRHDGTYYHVGRLFLSFNLSTVSGTECDLVELYAGVTSRNGTDPIYISNAQQSSYMVTSDFDNFTSGDDIISSSITINSQSGSVPYYLKGVASATERTEIRTTYFGTNFNMVIQEWHDRADYEPDSVNYYTNFYNSGEVTGEPTITVPYLKIRYR